MPSAPRRSSTGCCGATAFRRCRSGSASIFLRRRGDDAPLRVVEAAAILFTVLLAFMEIRHAVNGGDVYRVTPSLVEVRAAGLRRAGHGDRAGAAAAAHRQHRAQCRRGRCSRHSPASSACSGCCCWRTRCSGTIDVGGAFINLLLLAYALPAVLMLLLVLCGGGPRGGTAYANTIAAGALVLALTYVTLEIRRLLSRPGPDQSARPAAPSNTPIRSPGWPSASCCSASASSSIRSARGSRPPP